jgi:RNA polymerase sigma-70 factor (ECF subfamily)
VSLASLFLAHAPGAQRFAALGDLEATLARIVVDARAAWPDVALDEAGFVQHLAERMPADGDAAAALAAVRPGDLLMAWACGRGDEQALALFERHFVAPVTAYLARSNPTPAQTDEVKQALRLRLLVADGGAPPRIARFDGQGPLGGFVRVVATRLAIDLRRAERPRGPADDEPLAFRAPGADPELDWMRSRYRAELERAFRDTLAALETRDANVLALHFLDGTPADAIGALYGVSPRTVQRWIADARTRIMAEARRLLAERLRVSDAELDSVMALAQSQLDVSIHRLLERPKT